MDTTYDAEKYTRIFVGSGHEEPEVHGQAAALHEEEIGSDNEWFEPQIGVHRGHYMPTDDTWMDTSWATMSPERMRSFPVWTPQITAASENQVNNDRDFLYVQDYEPQSYEEAAGAGGAGITYRRHRRRTGGAGRRVWILLAVIIIGLLGAAFVFGQVKSESEAEMYIENYMGR